MNQILCGDTVIDTDDVQLAIKITGDDAQRRVFLRGNKTAILRGEEEAAFDVWAATLPRAGGKALSCRTCDVFDRASERCTWTIGHVAFPDCYEAREEEARPSNPGPLCATCSCYEAEAGHCAEFAGNHYPECWVAAKRETECASCRHYSGPPSYYCVPGRGAEKPGCYEEGNRKALRAARKAAEAKAKEEPPQKAKEAWPGDELHMYRISVEDTLPSWVRLKAKGYDETAVVTWNQDVLTGLHVVPITKQDLDVSRITHWMPIVAAPQPQEANLWPAELRERVAKGTAEEGADDRTG